MHTQWVFGSFTSILSTALAAATLIAAATSVGLALSENMSKRLEDTVYFLQNKNKTLETNNTTLANEKTKLTDKNKELHDYGVTLANAVFDYKENIFNSYPTISNYGDSLLPAVGYFLRNHDKNMAFSEFILSKTYNSQVV